VWYYDADMAADEYLTEEELNLGRTEVYDLAAMWEVLVASWSNFKD
jgi:hypothetical protein